MSHTKPSPQSSPSLQGIGGPIHAAVVKPIMSNTMHNSDHFIVFSPFLLIFGFFNENEQKLKKKYNILESQLKTRNQL